MAEQPTSNTSQPSGKGPAEPSKVTPVIKTLKKPDSAPVAPSQAAAEKSEEKASPAQPKAVSSAPKKKASTSKKKPAAKTKAANNNKTKTSSPAKSVKAAPKKKTATPKKKAAAKTPSTAPKPSVTAIAKPQTQTQFMETIMNTVNTKNFEKISQEAANAGKENMEALQKFASAYAQGYQDCIATYTDMVQKKR